MRLLLDTHVALWAITDSTMLNTEARRLILAPRNDLYVSAASIWEIAIKHSLGKGNMPISGSAASAWFAKAGYFSLPVTSEHAAQVETLPHHHNDPFDRLLVAQALVEPMRLLTHDTMIAQYNDTVILC